MLTWKAQELGLSAAVSNRLFDEAKGAGNQIMIGLSGRHSRPKLLSKSHTRTFSFMKKAPKVVLKDKNH